MARPEKNNVEYFPFLCKEGKAMFYLENKYGNDGYATWVKLLRQLAVTNNHWLNLSDPVEMMFLSSKCRVSEEVLTNIIKDLCVLGEFNSDLWNDNKIIFNEKFVESIQEAYKKRSNDCIDLKRLLILLDGLGIRKLDLSTLQGSDNPHSIVDNSIVDKTIKKEIKEEEIIYPDNLKNDAFILKFKEWLEYKKERKNSYKSSKSINSLLKQLSKYNSEFSIKLIDRSMSNSWQGLIFEKTDFEFKNFTKDNPGGSGAKQF